MTIKELRAALDAVTDHYPYKDSLDVRIAVSRGYPARIGARHTAGVKCAYKGIDWDSGYVTIQPDETLLAGSDYLEGAARFAHRVRTIVYGMRNDGRNKNANAIREIVEALDAWLPDRHEAKRREEE